MVKLSIIIPVYNVERYVGRCLNSLLQSDFTDYEIILIDDQSTDGSLTEANKYLPVFTGKLIIFQNRKNLGLSGTRNEGIRRAQGKYIYFLDADDWVEHDIFSKTIPKMEDENLDLLFFDFYLAKNEANYQKEYWYTKRPRGEISSTDFFAGIFARKFGNYSWCRITRKKLFNDNSVLYPANTRLFEDLAVTYRLVQNASKVALIPDVLYYYFNDNSGSLTKSFSYTGYKDSLKNFRGFENLIKNEYPQLRRGFLNYKFEILCTQYVESKVQDEHKIRHDIVHRFFLFSLLLSVKNKGKYLLLVLNILRFMRKIL